MGLDYNQILYDDLPNEDMKLVADDCGIDVAISLMQNLPGITIYIADRDELSNNMILVAGRCGSNILDRLQQHSNGISICIPKLPPKRLMFKYICDNFNGQNACDLALDLGVSQSTVYKILRSKMIRDIDESDERYLFEEVE